MRWFKMFYPKIIYYEKNIENYELGKMLLEKYKDVPKIEIESHNNIEELRKKQNSEFPKLKQNLIIGIRKTHKYVENHKVSDYLVPYTSSGCTAMCLYCYLVCNYNKCAYLRLFVNREEMLNKIIKTANDYANKKLEEDIILNTRNPFTEGKKELTFEIGSNSDLVLENTITGNLEWTIERFGENNVGYITFPTKFAYIDSLLKLHHKGRTIIRMSVNPQEIIEKVEFGTSKLNDRIQAINKLKDADYKVGILIAPVILVENWQELYRNLIDILAKELSEKAKEDLFFEVIFMTYSYVHIKINEEAFPNAIKLYDKNKMTGRGRGKYMYNKDIRKEGEEFFRREINNKFPNSKIIYIV